jgi:hypothetical protein
MTPAPTRGGKGWKSTRSTPLDVPWCDMDIVDGRTLTVDRFVRDYQSVGRPVLIRNGTRCDPAARNGGRECTFPALAKWTRDYLVGKFGSEKFSAGLIPYAKKYGRTDPSESNEAMPLRDFVAQRMGGDPAMLSREAIQEEGKGQWILFDQHWSKRQPLLGADVRTPRWMDGYADFLEPELSMGTYGSGAHFHGHNPVWNVLVAGRKRWFIVPSGAAYALKTNDDRHPLGFLYADKYQTYEKLRKAGVLIDCVQHEGDIVYLPDYASHATINLADTIAVAQEFNEFQPVTGSVATSLYGVGK